MLAALSAVNFFQTQLGCVTYGGFIARTTRWFILRYGDGARDGKNQYPRWYSRHLYRRAGNISTCNRKRSSIDLVLRIRSSVHSCSILVPKERNGTVQIALEEPTERESPIVPNEEGTRACEPC